MLFADLKLQFNYLITIICKFFLEMVKIFVHFKFWSFGNLKTPSLENVLIF